MNHFLYLPEYPTKIETMINLRHIQYESFDITKEFIMRNIFDGEEQKIDEFYKNLLKELSTELKLFSLNRENFIEFLSDPKYFLGKCYESSTNGKFLEENPQILLLSNCTLVKVENKESDNNTSLNANSDNIEEGLYSEYYN